MKNNKQRLFEVMGRVNPDFSNVPTRIKLLNTAERDGYITKWETTKVMIETVLTEQGPIDEAMGRTKLSNQLSIPFKLSFNTLLKYQIIKEDDGR